MENQFNTIILLRRHGNQAETMREALHCAFPHQLRIIVASCLDEVIVRMAEEDADVVVTDYHVPVSCSSMALADGLQVIRYLSRRRHRRVHTIVLAAPGDERHGPSCLSAGASAFVRESAAVEETVRALASFGTLYLEESEAILGDARGQVVYAINSRQPQNRAQVSAFLQGQVERMSEALHTGGFENLIMQGPGFEAVFEVRGAFGLFTSAASVEPGTPPAGHSLQESVARFKAPSVAQASEETARA